MDAMNEFYGASEYALSAGSVLVLMFGMGATLRLDDFRALVVHPRAVLVGLATQWIAVPLGAVAMTSGGAQAQLAAATQESKTFFGSCPECNAGQLAYVEGCVKCHICGYSECG